MKRSTTFTRGTGCYACRACARMTRDDGNGDSAGIRLCTQCYELGGLFNVLQDGGVLSDTDKSTIKANLVFLVSKGANVKQWAALTA